ncbi:MAG: hydrogenase nickel incorporation protein HypB [Azonexus sp.]
MCTICGCSGDGAALHQQGHAHAHEHHHHAGEGGHGHQYGHHHHQGAHDQTLSIPPEGGARHVAIEQDILAANAAQAANNRAHLAAHGMLALNLVSSPGSGKTTLLVATIERLVAEAGKNYPVAVIEGDQQTSRDADRIRATGVPAVQVNTGKGCHLDARMVARALDVLPHEQGGFLLIENVGNLVCPAPFDLGEAHKVVILSVTEGEDKPLKYPDMFRAADLMLLNKCDLLPYLDFDVAQAEAFARQVNPQLRILRVSATTGEGMDAWLAWLRDELAAVA